jgi:plasmid stabilization system protein ParE
MRQIVFLPIARKDLINVIDYIDADNPGAALLVANNIEKEISRLQSLPFLGKPCGTLDPALRELRSIFIHPVLFFYEVGENEIVIHRVLRSEQDWMKVVRNQSN